MKAKSWTLCIVNGNLCGGVWCSNTVYSRGRRLGFVEFLLRLSVIDWLAAALSLSRVVTDWGPHPDVAPSALSAGAGPEWSEDPLQ